MKKTSIILIAFILVATLQAQNRKALNIHKDGKVVQTFKLIDIDSITVTDINDEQQEPGTLVDGVAKLAEAGTLATVLGDQMLTLTSLKIIGEINGTDVKCLRQMLGGSEFSTTGTLTVLDLSESTIVIGGDEYYETYTTSNYTIGQSAFYECTNLVSAILPKSVTTISEDAFSGCSSLKDITIGEKVITIGDAFKNCSSLNVYIENLVAWCNIDFDHYPCNPLFAGYSNNAYDKFGSVPDEEEGGKLYINGELVTNLVISNEISEIKKYAFTGCSSITNVTISGANLENAYLSFTFCSNLKSAVIGSGSLSKCSMSARGSTFQNCFNMSSISFPEDATIIPDGFCMNCANLTEVIIPDKVEVIKGWAFKSCVGLKKITWGKNVKTIQRAAFGDGDVGDVDNITEIICYAENPPYIYGTDDWYAPLSHASKSITLKVPQESVNAYRNDSYWSKFTIETIE